MVVHDETERFAARPERFVHVGPERRDLVVGRHTREQHAAEESGRGDELHFPERVVEVVQQDLGDAGAATGRGRAEVGEPAVVRLQSGPPVLVLVAVRRRSHERARREERRDRVGEQDLGDDAVGFELGQPLLRVPVAVRVRTGEVGERVLERLRPFVELVVPARGEVLAVRRHRGARMTVGGDHRVAIGVHCDSCVSSVGGAAFGGFHSRK